MSPPVVRSLLPLAGVLAATAALPAQEPKPGQPAPATAAPPPPSGSTTNGAEAPWRLQGALGLPDWLHVQGEQRTRYESLHNQFRFRQPNATPPVRGYGDDEDVLALRTWLRLEARGDRFGGTLELFDARQYGIDDTGFADTTMVDTAAVLQAFLDVHLGELGGGRHKLRLGRETVDLGNRRLMARNAFRNTINSFTGANWIWTGKENSVRAFWTLPVERLPADFASIQDNEWQGDRQDTELQFWGVYFDHQFDDRTNVELYVFGLDEDGSTTRERELYTPGVRLNRRPKRGNLHWETELTAQLGHSKANTAATSPKLDHLAGFATAALGYTCDCAWAPALAVSWSWASGDQDPNDGDNERFDTLFGARRFEYGPTGIWGAVARSNLNSPEVRFTLQPSKAVDVLFAWRGVWLASERDAWTASGLRDRTGSSGTHVGDQFEVRLRWDIVPKSVNLEVGGAYLAEGSFQDRASGDQGRDAAYGYVQGTWWF
ncbi:MAG: alginate export family protein [Planctomycetes bacterium]|nr:alginate export family protein [Planctomycetota bacterium]